MSDNSHDADGPLAFAIILGIIFYAAGAPGWLATLSGFACGCMVEIPMAATRIAKSLKNINNNLKLNTVKTDDRKV